MVGQSGGDSQGPDRDSGQMRIPQLLALAGLTVALAATAGAQDTTSHKPGGVKKVASQVHHALKTAGNEVKDEAGEVAASTHHTLKKTGNHVKGEAARVTGDTAHVGGDVGKAAQHVSHAGKKLGHHVKHGVKSTAAKTHHALKKAGNDAKTAADTTIH